MKTFTIDGVTYKSKPFGFNMLCALENAGLSLDEVKKKPMLMMRTYVAECADVSYEEAGAMIERHVIGGGTYDKILECLVAEIDESDFFRALKTRGEEQGAEQETQKTPKKATK